MSLGFWLGSFIIFIIIIILLLLLLLLLLLVLLLRTLLFLLLLFRIALLKFVSTFFLLQRFYSDVILAPCVQCVCNFLLFFVYRECTLYVTVLLPIFNCSFLLLHVHGCYNVRVLIKRVIVPNRF